MWMAISSAGWSVIGEVAFLVSKGVQVLMSNKVTSFQLCLTFDLPGEQAKAKCATDSLVIEKYFMRDFNSELWQLLAVLQSAKSYLSITSNACTAKRNIMSPRALNRERVSFFNFLGKTSFQRNSPPAFLKPVQETRTLKGSFLQGELQIPPDKNVH